MYSIAADHDSAFDFPNLKIEYGIVKLRQSTSVFEPYANLASATIATCPCASGQYGLFSPKAGNFIFNSDPLVGALFESFHYHFIILSKYVAIQRISWVLTA